MNCLFFCLSFVQPESFGGEQRRTESDKEQRGISRGKVKSVEKRPPITIHHRVPPETAACVYSAASFMPRADAR